MLGMTTNENFRKAWDGVFYRTVADYDAEVRAVLGGLAEFIPAGTKADDDEAAYDEYVAEMGAPWCSYCDGLGHTASAHEVGVEDGHDEWEARMGVVSFADAWDLADPSRTAPCPLCGVAMVHGCCGPCIERDAEAFYVAADELCERLAADAERKAGA